MRLVLLAILALTPLFADDWPQWRGPERTGISEETGLLGEWPEGGPELLWTKRDLGDGYGTVAVVGDRLYLVANRGMDEEYVEARSVVDGSVVWSTVIGKVGNPDQQPAYPMARSTPTVDGDTIYVFSSDGDLAALQRATGEILWRKSVRRDLGGVPGKWAYAESPLVDGSTVVVAPGGAEATLAAFDKATGETKWRAQVPEGDVAGFASTIAVDAAGRRQYVQFLDGGVVGVDAATGEFLWRYDGTASGPANAATPVALDGRVYSTNARRFGGALVELTASGGGVEATEVYFSRPAPNSMGGQVLLDGVIYGTNSQGLVAADFETGELFWSETEGGPGSVQYADGRLYVHYESGEVTLVEATPEAYRERGRFTPPGQPEHLRGDREMAWAYPVVANGRLYVRDLGVLWVYAIEP